MCLEVESTRLAAGCLAAILGFSMREAEIECTLP